MHLRLRKNFEIWERLFIQNTLINERSLHWRCDRTSVHIESKRERVSKSDPIEHKIYKIFPYEKSQVTSPHVLYKQTTLFRLFHPHIHFSGHNDDWILIRCLKAMQLDLIQRLWWHTTIDRHPIENYLTFLHVCFKIFDDDNSYNLSPSITFTLFFINQKFFHPITFISYLGLSW